MVCSVILDRIIKALNSFNSTCWLVLYKHTEFLFQTLFFTVSRIYFVKTLWISISAWIEKKEEKLCELKYFHLVLGIQLIFRHEFVYEIYQTQRMNFQWCRSIVVDSSNQNKTLNERAKFRVILPIQKYVEFIHF